MRPGRLPERRRRGWRGRLRRWWLARLPLTDSWTLTQGNIYILPTKAGLVFAFTLLLMLLASINYQLNLGFALTFLLAGCGLVSMHLTHGTLRGLSFHLRPTHPVFVGDSARLDVVVTNPGRQRHGVALHYDDPNQHGRSWAWMDLPAQGQTVAQLALVPAQRGPMRVPTLLIETGFPFGLFRAWSLWRPSAQVLAWPRPEQPAPPLPAGSTTGDDHRPSARRQQGAELEGVRAWRRGDTLRQVLWKKVARSGELVSRDTAGTSSRDVHLEWQATQGLEAEARLSRLAAWVLAAEQEGHRWRLQLPGQDLPSGQGDAQRRAALDALAMWGLSA